MMDTKEKKIIDKSGWLIRKNLKVQWSAVTLRPCLEPHFLRWRRNFRGISGLIPPNTMRRTRDWEKPAVWGPKKSTVRPRFGKAATELCSRKRNARLYVAVPNKAYGKIFDFHPSNINSDIEAPPTIKMVWFTRSAVSQTVFSFFSLIFLPSLFFTLNWGSKCG